MKLIILAGWVRDDNDANAVADAANPHLLEGSAALTVVAENDASAPGLAETLLLMGLREPACYPGVGS